MNGLTDSELVKLRELRRTILNVGIDSAKQAAATWIAQASSMKAKARRRMACRSVQGLHSHL